MYIYIYMCIYIHVYIYIHIHIYIYIYTYLYIYIYIYAYIHTYVLLIYSSFMYLFIYKWICLKTSRYLAPIPSTDYGYNLDTQRRIQSLSWGNQWFWSPAFQEAPTVQVGETQRVSSPARKWVVHNPSASCRCIHHKSNTGPIVISSL